jgi:hypothetical protein
MLPCLTWKLLIFVSCGLQAEALAQFSGKMSIGSVTAMGEIGLKKVLECRCRCDEKIGAVS